METLNVNRLREEAITEARRGLEAAKTTTEKHHARLALQRALRAKGVLNA